MPVDARFSPEIWADRKDLAPEWAHRLVLRVAKHGAFHAPRLKFVDPMFVERLFRFGGGRFYPEQNAIAVVNTDSYHYDYCVVCHELAHAYACSKGDCRGAHDRRFYDIVEAIYKREGVGIVMARHLEESFPRTWNRGSW